MSGAQTTPVLRAARFDELTALAKLYRRSRHELLPFAPCLYTAAQDLCFFQEVLWKQSCVSVAEIDGQLAGMMALRESRLDQLYVAPEFVRLGIGSYFIERAKSKAKGGLDFFALSRTKLHCNSMRPTDLPRYPEVMEATMKSACQMFCWNGLRSTCDK
ncbi:GNAT family N-acetyltransferase [Polycladidibacter hongkongensis]|uniref:GNAT family N-acetyltransferase n=1 Tax=Polycladidibacter hongkongensis TaxID=1647556 RepID=UPI000832B619|nr:GNAT family N-acetyltransferase [Pseudovibrio hongkongensis]